jgi:hypothetical protein
MERWADYKPLTEVLMVLCIAVLAGTASALQAGDQAAPAGQSKNLEQLKAKGKDASLTVLPVGLAGNPSPQVGEVFGMLLERAGMTNVEIGAAEFRAPAKADLAQTASSLSEFVRANPIKTDYALFADFLGSPGKVAEVRGVIVNKQGEIAWQDHQTADDADFKRIQPREPMECILLVVERLRPVLNLGDPNREDAPQGKLAQQWEQKTGVPNETEVKAMNERQQTFKKVASKATLVVYPARAGGKPNPESAVRLARIINDAGLIKSTAASEGPQLDIKGNMNEQKMLWDMARSFREHVQAHPPEADYAIFADYLMGKDMVGGVHFAVCDRKGELVIVDYQNDHHPDFNAIKPKSAEDCDRLVLKRFEGYCK